MYEVGQVLYLLLSKNKKVAPVQVVEQIVRKSIDGEQVSYMVQLPSNRENSRVSLSKINCEIFTSPSLIKQSMMKNATDAINNLVSNSIKIAQSVFSETSSDSEEISEQRIDDIATDTQGDDGNRELDQVNDLVTVDLGDGIKGKIDMSALGQVI